MSQIPIPPAARRAAQAVIGDHVPLETIAAAIAGALAAWPRMGYLTNGSSHAVTLRPNGQSVVVLPIGEEPNG